MPTEPTQADIILQRAAMYLGYDAEQKNITGSSPDLAAIARKIHHDLGLSGEPELKPGMTNYTDLPRNLRDGMTLLAMAEEQKSLIGYIDHTLRKTPDSASLGGMFINYAADAANFTTPAAREDYLNTVRAKAEEHLYGFMSRISTLTTRPVNSVSTDTEVSKEAVIRRALAFVGKTEADVPADKITPEQKENFVPNIAMNTLAGKANLSRS